MLTVYLVGGAAIVILFLTRRKTYKPFKSAAHRHWSDKNSGLDR